MAPRGVDHVGLDLQVVADEIRRVSVVGVDASHLRRRQHDPFGSRVREEACHRRLVAQIQLGAAAQYQIPDALPFQLPDNRGPDEPAVTGHEYSAELTHGSDRP